MRSNHGCPGLRPGLRDDPLANFYRGAYDVAVFLAFRQVEIAVRDASGVDDSGTKLMGKAFSSPHGSLRDPHGLPGEEDAVRELFSGAVGYFRNATSHRDVNLTANACADLLGFATQLLTIVDQRAQRRTTGWAPR